MTLSVGVGVCPSLSICVPAVISVPVLSHTHVIQYLHVSRVGLSGLSKPSDQLSNSDRRCLDPVQVACIPACCNTIYPSSLNGHSQFSDIG